MKLQDRAEAWNTEWLGTLELQYQLDVAQADRKEAVLMAQAAVREQQATVLGGSAAAANERRLGLVPLLLHPDPRRVIFLVTGTHGAESESSHEDDEDDAAHPETTTP